MKKNTVSAVALMLFLTVIAGCASQGYNTQKGAAIGAGVGALAGQALGRDTASTLIGAGVGALVGGLGGNAVDQHVSKQAGPGGQGTGGVAVASPGAGQDPPGRWVEVPGSWQGGKWVPAHTVWVPVNP